MNDVEYPDNASDAVKLPLTEASDCHATRILARNKFGECALQLRAEAHGRGDP
jgi:hypothetical protein